MVVRQGDIYWIDRERPIGSGPGFAHPHVVIQNNLLNESPIRTVVVLPLTTNLKLAKAPGNVALDVGEGNLSKASVVNVSQPFTVNRRELGDFVGTITAPRVRQILQGFMAMLEPRESEA